MKSVRQEAPMHASIDTDFIAGAIVSVVLVTTLLVVPLVRYFVLVTATCAIAVVYFRGGILDLITCIHGLQTEIGGNPIFSIGIFAGALLVALIRSGKGSRRATE
jgi:hypothetical protein